MKKITSVLLTVYLCFILCACGSGDEKSSGRTSIVVTVFPVYDFVRAVTGGLADIKLLIAPGTEVHTYDPSPSDIVALEKSDLFIRIGGESEKWAERIAGGSDSNINTVKMMDCVKLLSEDGEDEYDEHIWTSPANAILMVDGICRAVSEIDGDNSDVYRKNADIYIEKIKSVQAEIKAAVSACDKPFVIVADRFPFKYLMNEFGIEYAAAFGGCATSTDISLKTMARLVDEVNGHSLKCAYYIEMSSRAIANALSEQTGVTLYELHSAHNVTLDDFNSGVTYTDIMERNAAALKKGLIQ